MYRGGLFRRAYSIHHWLKLSKCLACFLFLSSLTLSVGHEDFSCFLKYEVIHDTGRVAVLFVDYCRVFKSTGSPNAVLANRKN